MANTDKTDAKTAEEIFEAGEKVEGDIAEVNAAADEAAARPVKDAVTVRVLKRGHGEVHTGRMRRNEETGAAEFETFSKGDKIPNLARKIALELEDRGFVEIEDEE